MEKILNKTKCEVCNENPVLGLGFGNKWVCGMCLKKLEDKLKKEKNMYYDKIIKEIRENGKNL